MRHQKRIKRLGRTAAHRKATLAALSSALIEHKRIETTLPKAKALRSYVEPLITRAKEDTTANRRQVFRRLQSKNAVKELFGDIAASIGDRPGGYTRVIKLGLRQGDSAEMAVIELVDYNDVPPEGGTSGRRRTRRGSGGGRSRRSSGGGSTQQTGPSGDSLTKIYGVGKAFAQALNDAGITTYQELADADLTKLRKAISLGSEGAEAIANEETWAEQAALLAAGDKEGHDAYVDRLREGDEGAAPTEDETAEEAAPDTPEAGDPSGSAASSADAPEAEAPAAEDASTQPDDAPEAPANQETIHPDTPQGAAPSTGEPPPESHQENQGRGGEHRG